LKIEVQGICQVIDRKINEIVFTFLHSWELKREAPELSRWQDIIDYVVARNEVKGEVDAISIFKERTKEKEKEISDMALGIEQYLNGHTDLDAIDIFDFHLGKSILGIIIGKERHIAESIREVYKRSISPTDTIWHLYCMVQTRNHICNSEKMSISNIVFLMTTVSRFFERYKTQFNYIVSYIIRNVRELLRDKDDEAKQRALSIF